MNKQYWGDLTAEGRALALLAEGEARDLKIPRHAEDRAVVRSLAEAYRTSQNDLRYRDPERREHQLQDVIDAFRFIYPYASKRIGPRGEPR